MERRRHHELIIIWSVFLVTITLASCCTMTDTKQQSKMPEYIGTAEMHEDGTIVMYLRAEGPGGIVGHGVVRYPLDDPDYKDVLRHLGGLKKGESKPVPPWPDE